MKRALTISSSLIVLTMALLAAVLLLPASVMAADSSQAAATATPTVTETLPPPDVGEHTNTPEPTLPSPSATPIPTVEDTGLPVVIPLIQSGPPDDGYGPDSYPIYINPLTGLIVRNPADLERRPVAIKVTNHPRYVRPQSGLSLADLVFEYYMEQGIPRFIAVFYGQEAEKVGPVRSGRLFDEHIFRMYDSYFTYGYADKRVIEYFNALEKDIVNRFVLENGLDHANKCGVSTPSRLCRDPELEGYNTMFANTLEIQEYFDRLYESNTRPDLSGMSFSNHVYPSNNPGTLLKIRWSSIVYNYWQYDPGLGLYLRWQETKNSKEFEEEAYAPQYDALTNEQLSASNVVFLVMDHKFYAHTEGMDIMGMDFNGSGRAYVFRDGFYYPAIWARPEQGGVLQLYSLDGESFPLKPGQTWFEVMNQYTHIEQTGSTWFYHFHEPPVEEGETIFLLNPHMSPLEWFYEDQNPGKPMPWYGVLDNTPVPTQSPTPTETKEPGD
jgi:hypothetical protein